MSTGASKHDPGAWPIPHEVRDAVAGVVREARDTPDKPFEGELALALTLVVWARFIKRGPFARALVVMAYGSRGARFEEVDFEAFEVDPLHPSKLDTALDALEQASSRPVAGVVMAVPVGVPVARTHDTARVVLAHVDEGGNRYEQMLITDGRWATRGGQVQVETNEAGRFVFVDPIPAELPDGFVEALGGFPWSPPGAAPRGCSLGSGGAA